MNPAAIAAELRVNRANTRAYIASDPTVMRLKGLRKVSDGAGGTRRTWGGAGHEREVTLRVVNNNYTSVAVSRRTVDGENVTPSLQLIAEWDADVRVGDHFTYLGEEYELVFIQPETRYEKLCEAAHYA